MKQIIVAIIALASLVGCKESDYYPPYSEKHKNLVQQESKKNPEAKCDDYETTLISNGIGGYSYIINCN